MNKKSRHLGAAALALVVCLAAAPVTSARHNRDDSPEIRERVIRVIQKIQQLFRGITSHQDTLIPPRP